MCFCCGNYGIYSPYGFVIANLKPGDNIIIKAGNGHPKAKEDTEDVISEVDGFSAKTVSGIKLCCSDKVVPVEQN